MPTVRPEQTADCNRSHFNGKIAIIFSARPAVARLDLIDVFALVNRINSPIATMGISSTCSRPIVNFSGYYRKRASSIELSEATAWFEYLQLSMQTVSKGSTVHYQVQAQYTPPCCQDSELVWTVSRSFDAYRRFRKQLLRRLQLGHACTAECKWLHSVVKNHFPKSKFLAVNSPRTTESRRQSLIRILQTLQASLVNRGNQGCNVLVHGVCYAFVAFILGENFKLPDMDKAMALSRCSSEQSTTNSLGRYSSEQTTRNSFGAKHTQLSGSNCANYRTIGKRRRSADSLTRRN